MPPARPSKKIDTLARRLWAIGDVSRLRILKLLPTEPAETRCCNVCELGKKLNLAQPTVSHHLRILRQAGLIHGKRCCRDVYYRADGKATGVLLAELALILTKQK